ncbi:hypothetical protein IFM89_038855 [Coptis chinensis]|uniref:Uncharacterized protein n=1 Tax=Coptis chinensis TaxID=261450 RepID=A0A835I655_9MAGN|nr:hypothetical protein IFM89_038855 [Coptis chinensis]
MRMMEISLSCKRIVKHQLASSTNSSAANHILCRHGNALSSRFLVNSSGGWNAHTPFRYFSSGVPSQQGEEGSANMIKLWKKQESLESTVLSFLKSEKQKEHHFTHMQRETEKLQEEMKKMRTELRFVEIP